MGKEVKVWLGKIFRTCNSMDNYFVNYLVFLSSCLVLEPAVVTGVQFQDIPV
jgi:hypothetical protein